MHRQHKQSAPNHGPFPLERLGENLYTASNGAWPGLSVNEWECCGHHLQEGFSLDKTTIFLRTSGQVEVTTRIHGTVGSYTLDSGSASIVSSAVRFDSIAWNGRFRVLTVEIDPSRVIGLFGPDAQLPQRLLKTELEVRDLQLTSLLKNIAAEVRAAGLSGRLYSEYLSLALITYLCKRYALCGCDGRAGKALLTDAQLSEIDELIRADMSGDLSLSALADAIHLSTYHFTRLFKNTLGLPPHQYVTQKRIERARQLLEG